MNQVLRNIIGVIVGIIVGGLSIAILENITHTMFPMPEIVNEATFTKYMNEAPATSLLMVIAAHGLGAFVSAFFVPFITKNKDWRIVLIPTSFFFTGGIVNFLTIAHPTWMIPVDLMIYFPAGYIAMTLKTKGRFF